MDLQTIAKRTGLSLRKIRYTFDHRLLPGLRVKHATRLVGHPRDLTDTEALGVACGAALVDGGARRDTIIALLDALVETRWSDRGGQAYPALAWANFAASDIALASVGDGRYVRLQVGKHDTKWMEAAGGGVRPEYSPRVLLQVNLALLRRALQTNV